MTAHVIGDGALAWQEADQDGTLAKPFTLAQLAQVLGRFLAADMPASPFVVVSFEPRGHGGGPRLPAAPMRQRFPTRRAVGPRNPRRPRRNGRRRLPGAGARPLHGPGPGGALRPGGCDPRRRRGDRRQRRPRPEVDEREHRRDRGWSGLLAAIEGGARGSRTIPDARQVSEVRAVFEETVQALAAYRVSPGAGGLELTPTKWSSFIVGVRVKTNSEG